MSRPERDIIVVVRQGGSISEEAIEQELKVLSRLLEAVETKDHFCSCHELVNRNRITRKYFKIREAIRYQELKPFCFLIGRN
jgi:hypothetical protein